MIDRSAFRTHPLAGAMLHFQPASGIHIRIENESTRQLKRCAPRVVMFGITNKCNLRCDFCSRDTGRSSTWTVASASAALSGLAAAGTLEVAFGGGEPFAFRGFAELVADLYANTPLVLNVTTNGTLINKTNFALYAGRFGQVRVSIYEGTGWRDGCRVLAEYGQRWGANLIVDDAMLEKLPALMAELVVLGCYDVSLLAYIGPDASKQLSLAGRARLAAIAQDAPLACRLSVCFGDTIPLDRLFDGADGFGDCGAGLDFVTITPDQKILGCSFQDGGLPATTAQEILDAWQNQGGRMALPAQRNGCTRCKDNAKVARKVPPIAIWQAYSGNNSGECVMVAKFDAVRDANNYLSKLLPTWTPGSSLPPEWRQLMLDEGICSAAVPEWRETPNQFLAIGRSVIALSYGLGDEFPELRSLAWKKGAYLVTGDIHVHDTLYLVAVVRASNERDAHELANRDISEIGQSYLHGDLVFLTTTVCDFGSREEQSLKEAADFLHEFADARPLAVEAISGPLDQATFIAAKKQLGSPRAITKRLAMKFNGEDGQTKAANFAQLVNDGKASVAGDCVLVSGIERRKRLAVLGYRYGANVIALDGAEIRIYATFQLPIVKPQKGTRVQQPVIDIDELEKELRRKFTEESHLKLITPHWMKHGARLTIHTARPDFLVTELSPIAQSLGAQLSVWITEIDELGLALRRLIADVRR